MRKALATIAATLALAACGQQPTPAPEAAPVVEQQAPNDCNQVFTEECARRAQERNKRAYGDWDSVRSDAGKPESEPNKNN